MRIPDMLSDYVVTVLFIFLRVLVELVRDSIINAFHTSQDYYSIHSDSLTAPCARLRV